MVPSLQNYLWKKYSHITIVIEVSHTTPSCPKNAVSLLELYCFAVFKTLWVVWLTTGKTFPSIKWFEYQDKTKVQISLKTFSAVCLHILSISLSSMSFWPLECRLNWISPVRKNISNIKRCLELSFFYIIDYELIMAADDQALRRVWLCISISIIIMQDYFSKYTLLVS